jgi:uncharacterized protein (TIGR02145 family)
VIIKKWDTQAAKDYYISSSPSIFLLDRNNRILLKPQFIKETGTAYWSSPNQDATNSRSFTGLPGGYRIIDGTFYDIGNFGYWWCSSEEGTTGALNRNLYYDNDDAYRHSGNKKSDFSVRCLRD